MDTFRRSFFNIFCITALSLSFKAGASDDEYLRMLEGEAEDVKLDQSGQLKRPKNISSSTSDITKANWKWEGDLEGNAIPAGLAQDEFGSLLKQNFYGTFVFFRKLNSVDQQTVYYHYSKAPKADLDSIRQEILNLLKN